MHLFNISKTYIIKKAIFHISDQKYMITIQFSEVNSLRKWK